MFEMLSSIHDGDGSIDNIFIVVGSVQELERVEVHTISELNAVHVGSAPWVRVVVEVVRLPYAIAPTVVH